MEQSPLPLEVETLVQIDPTAKCEWPQSTRTSFIFALVQIVGSRSIFGNTIFSELSLDIPGVSKRFDRCIHDIWDETARIGGNIEARIGVFYVNMYNRFFEKASMYNLTLISFGREFLAPRFSYLRMKRFEDKNVRHQSTSSKAKFLYTMIALGSPKKNTVSEYRTIVENLNRVRGEKHYATFLLLLAKIVDKRILASMAADDLSLDKSKCQILLGISNRFNINNPYWVEGVTARTKFLIDNRSDKGIHDGAVKTAELTHKISYLDIPQVVALGELVHTNSESEKASTEHFATLLGSEIDALKPSEMKDFLFYMLLKLAIVSQDEGVYKLLASKHVQSMNIGTNDVAMYMLYNSYSFALKDEKYRMVLIEEYISRYKEAKLNVDGFEEEITPLHFDMIKLIVTADLKARYLKDMAIQFLSTFITGTLLQARSSDYDNVPRKLIYVERLFNELKLLENPIWRGILNCPHIKHKKETPRTAMRALQDVIVSMSVQRAVDSPNLNKLILNVIKINRWIKVGYMRVEKEKEVDIVQVTESEDSETRDQSSKKNHKKPKSTSSFDVIETKNAWLVLKPQYRQWYKSYIYSYKLKIDQQRKVNS